MQSQKNLACMGPPEATCSCSEQVSLQQVAKGHVQPSSEHFWGQRCPVSSAYLCRCHPPSQWEKLPMLRVLPVAYCPVTIHLWEESGSTFSGPSCLKIIDRNMVSLTLLFSASPYPSASHIHPGLRPPGCLGGPPLDLLQYETPVS